MASISDILNSYASLPAPPDLAGEAQQAFSSIPAIHGADLSNVPKLPFQVSPEDFVKATSPTSLPASVTNGSSGSGIGSFLSNLWGRITGPFEGAMAQMMADSTQQPAVKGKPLPAGTSFHFPLAGLIPGFIHGLEDSNWAHQAYAQQKQNQMHALDQQGQQMHEQPWQTGVMKGLLGTELDTVSNPITYVPMGKVFQGIGAVGKATGLPTALNALKHSAPEPVRQTLNAVTSVFKPISGARQPFLNAVSRMVGKTQSGTNEILTNLKNIFKDTTPEQRTALTHALESTAPGTPLSDPVLEALRQKVEPLLEQATKQSLERGLIKSTINPADYGVARYIPHVNVGKLDENALPFADITRRNPTIDASKARGLEGTIQAINNASGNKVFEDDLAKILAYHLGQINKASTARDLIDEAMQHGLPVGGAVKAGDQFPGTFQKAVEYTSPHTGETVLLPESEARYLQQLRTPPSELKQTLSKAYQGTVNKLNQLMFMSSPLVHILNNLGTQTLTHAPAVFAKMPKYMKEAWKGVEPGSQMDYALKNGALHLSSIMHGASTPKDMANQLVKELQAKSGVPQTLKNILKGYSELTPRVEQAYRAAAFEHALEKGMSPDEAANWVRSIYGGRIAGDATSPAEKAMTSVMPFFNWTKTAITSNVKNAAKNPFPYLLGFNTLNNYNEQVTGHGMADNPNPLSIALPWTNSQGNQEYWGLYSPPFDVAKLGKEVASNGARGLLDFAFNRFNPVAKFAGQAATGEQNPFANPLDKYNVEPYPALPSEFNKRGVFFGDKGPKVPAYLGQFLQDISNPLSTVDDFQQKGAGDTLLTQLLGGTISAPNPQSQQKQQQWQTNEMLKEFKSYLKKQAGGQ